MARPSACRIKDATDSLLDRCTRKIRHMDAGLQARSAQYGMIPGLSTHMPESVVYADESGLDVDTYIQMYNSMGFLMQVEVDWVAQIIREREKAGDDDQADGGRATAPLPGVELRLEHHSPAGYGDRRHHVAG